MSDQAPLPDFELPAPGNQRFQLSAFAGHPFVLYFCPGDDTPVAPTRDLPTVSSTPPRP